MRNYSKPKMTASNNKNGRANNSKRASGSKDKETVKADNKDNTAVKADNRAETSKKASSKDKEETVSYSKDKVAVKANSRTRWMLIVMEMHPVRVIPEDSKVKSQQKTTDKRQQTKVSHWHMKSIVWLRPWATKGMS